MTPNTNDPDNADNGCEFIKKYQNVTICLVSNPAHMLTKLGEALQDHYLDNGSIMSGIKTLH
jgi:hypothetical protein